MESPQGLQSTDVLQMLEALKVKETIADGFLTDRDSLIPQILLKGEFWFPFNVLSGILLVAVKTRSFIRKSESF